MKKRLRRIRYELHLYNIGMALDVAVSIWIVALFSYLRPAAILERLIH